MLSTVTYQDEQSGFLRPLFYRLSIAEMGKSLGKGEKDATRADRVVSPQSSPTLILHILTQGNMPRMWVSMAWVAWRTS